MKQIAKAVQLRRAAAPRSHHAAVATTLGALFIGGAFAGTPGTEPAPTSLAPAAAEASSLTSVQPLKLHRMQASVSFADAKVHAAAVAARAKALAEHSAAGAASSTSSTSNMSKSH